MKELVEHFAFFLDELAKKENDPELAEVAAKVMQQADKLEIDK